MRITPCISLFHFYLVFLSVFVISVNAKLRRHHGVNPDKIVIARNKATHHITARHAHFSYHPPIYIHYMCRYCKAPRTYPVYHSLLPAYVYKYRESGSRFSDLLTGLALYNLGRAASEHDHVYHKRSSQEQCSLHVVGHEIFDETLIPCFMLSTFMETTSQQTNETPHLDITSSQIDVDPYVSSKGAPIPVTPDQECVLWHNTTLTKGKHQIPCTLLKKYSETLKPAGVPVYIWFPLTLAGVIIVVVFCQCFSKKSKDPKEEEAINDFTVIGYSSHHHS